MLHYAFKRTQVTHAMSLDDYLVIASRSDLRSRDVRFEKGFAAATMSGRLSFDQYFEQVLAPAVEKGAISDGSKGGYDDRKMRFDRVEGSTVYLGATHFYEYESNSELGEEEAKQFMEQGNALHDDPYAFFARPLGVTILPITNEGSLVLGRRLNKQYHNYLNGAAGYVTFRTPTKSNLENDAERELWEEFGVSRIENLLPIGMSAHPKTGETDITYLAFVNHINEHFTSGKWKQIVTFYDHRIEHDDPLVLLKSHREVHELLAGTHPHSGPMMYATHHGLTQLSAVDLAA